METQVPDDLSMLADDELRTLETALVAEFDGAVDTGSQDVVMLGDLADQIDRVRGELSDREVRALEAAEAVAALADRVHKSADGESEMESPEQEIEIELPMAAETVATVANTETLATIEVVPVPEIAVPVTIPQEVSAVTASVRKPSASAVRQHAQTPTIPDARPEVVITAAADIPGYNAGQNVGILDVAKAMHAKARTLSNGSSRIPVASFSTGISDEFRLGADLSHNLDVLAKVRDPKSLVASGGWCAPSQNMYDLLGIDGGDGLIDLPTVQITRGGINVPDFIDISEATGALWTWTEADDEDAGGETIKPCLQIPCPTFTDYRLIAEGLCLTHGNLSDRAFPELTQRFIQLTLNAHLHRLSGAIVNNIANTATAFAPNNIAATSALGNFLLALEAARQDYISKYLMPVNSLLEAVLPSWTRSMVRGEIAMRQGIDAFGVTDAQIDEYFRVRGLRVQYVLDYKPWSTGGETPDLPTNAFALVYAAGGYVRGDGGVIDLGVVRDSVLNATNDYTAAWTEQLYLVAQMGPDAYEVEVPLLADAGGFTGCCPAAPAV